MWTKLHVESCLPTDRNFLALPFPCCLKQLISTSLFEWMRHVLGFHPLKLQSLKTKQLSDYTGCTSLSLALTNTCNSISIFMPESVMYSAQPLLVSASCLMGLWRRWTVLSSLRFWCDLVVVSYLKRSFRLKVIVTGEFEFRIVLKHLFSKWWHMSEVQL
jgi:hypothetical protein